MTKPPIPRRSETNARPALSARLTRLAPATAILAPAALLLSPLLLGTITSCGTGGGLPGPLRDSLGGNRTIAALLTHGVPRWEALVPSLPAAFSRGEGITSNERGVPSAVRAESGLLSDTLAMGGANVVLDEAHGLSREPLVLAREAELAARTLLAPLLDVLSDARLFSRLSVLASTNGTDANASEGGAALMGETGRDAWSPSSHPLFRALRERGELAVRFPKADKGVPSALFLSAPKDAAGLTFRPVWLDAKGRALAPAEIALSLGAGGESALTLRFAPALAEGLSRVFPSGLGACEGDAILLKATRGSKGDAGVEIQRRECADDASKARVGGFSLVRDSKGRYLVGGAFRSAQDLSKAGGLRASFGALPLFAFRAAIASGDDAPLAVDVAALPTDTADAAAAAKGGASPFASFGVSKVVTDYAVSSFWKSSYGSNRAVRALLCDTGSAAGSDLGAFCAGTVSGRAALTGMETAASTVRSAKPALSFVTDADALIDALDALVGVLSIRNTMAFSLSAPPRYIDSEGEIDTGLGAEVDDARAALADVRDPFPFAKAADASFEARVVTEGELEAALPLDGSELLSRTVRDSCVFLLTDTLAKAGMAPAAAARLCGD